MKKLLLLFSLPLLFVANQSFAQTQQSVVTEILAKTEYKNVYGFLNAISDGTKEELSCFLKYKSILQPYLDKGTIKYAPNSAIYNVTSSLERQTEYFESDDTVLFCGDKLTFGVMFLRYSGEISVSFYLDNKQSLKSMWVVHERSGEGTPIPFILPDDIYTEMPILQVNFMKEDTSIMFEGKKLFFEYVNAHVNLKNELLDNDMQGRMLTTNLSNSDSVLYSIDGGSNWQELPQYILFNEAKDIVVKNYYKGCKDSVLISKNSATELPRIHDTIYITKTDTVYINKTAIINKQTNLNVWPNPTTTFVNAEAEEPFSYTLLNNAGVILKKEEGESSYTISMKEYPDGVYYIKTSDGVIRKIVKE